MFILDTNVVSELRRPERAEPSVVAWATKNDISLCYLTAVTVFEIELGIAQIERRDPAQGKILRTWFDHQVLTQFHERVLPFDLVVAQKCASLHVPNPRSERDAMITATALVHGMTVVTRNIADFADTGVSLLNPWVPVA